MPLPFPAWQHRTALLLGEESLNILREAHVAIVGVGGVGGTAAEALARAGVGKITLVDGDTIDATNRNRQVIALSSNEGESKVSELAKRLHDINPDLVVYTHHVFLKDEVIQNFIETPFDYVIDAIDSLSAKAWLIHSLIEKKIPVIVSLGSAGKMNPALIRVCQLNQTQGCPLARALRQRLKQIGTDLSKVECVFSEEVPMGNCEVFTEEDSKYGKRSARGTISYLPPMFGLWAASVVIRRLSKK